LDDLIRARSVKLEPDLAVVDAHCHVDLYSDPKAVVAQAEALRIRTIAVTNAPSVFSFTRDVTAECRYVRPAAGLHPELVHSHGHELERLWPLLEETRYVGEVGLDYVTTDSRIRARQREVFGAIVERCAALGNKILTIHSRRAAADVIATVGPTFPGKAILHWFSGTVRQLEQAAAAGFFFSVNPSVLSSKSGRTLAASMPRERVLTETDGPFVKLGARPTTPPDTALVVQALAVLWHMEPAQARDVVATNLQRLVEW
jgi:TatD DNase family protein